MLSDLLSCNSSAGAADDFVNLPLTKIKLEGQGFVVTAVEESPDFPIPGIAPYGFPLGDSPLRQFLWILHESLQSAVGGPEVLYGPLVAGDLNAPHSSLCGARPPRNRRQCLHHAAIRADVCFIVHPRDGRRFGV